MQFRVLGARVVVARAGSRMPRAPTADLLVLSPGPGRPEEHPFTMAVADGRTAPVFGVCLGMQAIALAFGGRVVPAREIIHGRTSRIYHNGAGCFAGLPLPFVATRYHSLAVASLGPDLDVTAWTEDGEVMAIRHRFLSVEAVQFHPESVRTQGGLRLLGNVVAGIALRRG